VHNYTIAISIFFAGAFAGYEVWAYYKLERAELEYSILKKQLDGISAVSAQIKVTTIGNINDELYVELSTCLDNSGTAPITFDIESNDSFSIAELSLEGKANQDVRLTRDTNYSKIPLYGLIRPELKVEIKSLFLPPNIEKCFQGIHKIQNAGLYVVQFRAKPISGNVNRGDDRSKNFVSGDLRVIFGDQIEESINIESRKHFIVKDVAGGLTLSGIKSY
jgi:hypothetical protein